MKINYHSDHLGSASFVTDAEGAVMQHLQYLPYGELFVSQRNSDEFDSRYKFTAKELDNETIYTYFGARYYDADLSSWLSVDPLSDKYPSTSAYMYCLGNPVKIIDPNGKDSRISIVKNEGGGGEIVISSTIHLYGRNADNYIEDVKQVWSNLNKESIYQDENGNNWTVRFNLDFKVNHNLDDLDKGKKGLSYDNFTSKVEGVEKGDNFVCTDCIPEPGSLETADYSGSRTISPTSKTILHGVFHNLGFDDQYSDANEIMYGKVTGENPKYIGEERFNNAAKYILDDLKWRQDGGNPNYKPDKEGIINIIYYNEPFER